MTVTRTLLVAAAFSLAALCLAACAIGPDGSSGRAAAAINPGQLYPLKTGPAADRIALSPHVDGLSAAQVEAIKALVARRAEMGGGVVTVSLPQGGDAAAVGRTADAAQALLNGAGAPVRRSTYESTDAKAPLLVAYDYEAAEVPRCGREWGDLMATQDNQVYGNFGCAVTANMAVQIAHPSDIARPRGEDAPDADRRMTVLDKYKAGKVTSADEPQASPAIALNVGK